MAQKKVIDSDLMVCLEKFEASQTSQILEKYQKMGKWDNVETDSDGDIILSNDDY
jgi:hypothetical protein